MAKHHYVIGKKFGKWLVLSGPHNKKHLCRCECGKEYLRDLCNIKRRNISGCIDCHRSTYIPEMVGKIFQELTVLDLAYSNGNNFYYRCKCSCGEERICNGSSLRRGRIQRCKSCKRAKHIGHGMKGSSIWVIWMGIKARCLNPNNRAYARYGGRGIKLCDRWHKFELFYEDMGNRPDGKQIDRIDNDGSYSKENCRWVTPKENCNNRRKKCA